LADGELIAAVSSAAMVVVWKNLATHNLLEPRLTAG
jgi:hypothetical protein